MPIMPEDPEPRRRRGRPSLDPRDRSVQLCLTIPAARYDAYARRALERGISVASIVRADLAELRRLRRDPDNR